MPPMSCGELLVLWAEKLRTVHSCEQLLSGKTEVCGGQAEGTGGKEKHLPPSQLPHAHKHMTHVTVLQPLALSGISPDYTVPRSRGED